MDTERNYNCVVEMDDVRYDELESWIATGKQRAIRVFQELERNIPIDYLVDTKSLDFIIGGGSVTNILLKTRDNEFSLHSNAVSQMVQRTNILTGRVADKMINAVTDEDRWGCELLLHNLRTIFRKCERKRVLLRAVQCDGYQEVRGFLSDKYRRMNSGPIFQQFAETCNQFGAVPVSVPRYQSSTSYNLDLRVGLGMYLPFIFRPVDTMVDELLIIGLSISNSDFGVGALSISLNVLRIACSNLMVTRNEIRKIHLGARLGADIKFEEDTYAKDTEAMALVTRDVVNELFSEESVNGYLESIRIAATTEVDADAIIENLRSKGHLLKAESESVKQLYKSADVRLMPAGNTAWRASNAVSLFANQQEESGDKDRALELRGVAGSIIDNLLK